MRDDEIVPSLDIPFGLPLTAAQFEQVPWVEGLRIELWEGNLDVSASAQAAWHGLIKHRIVNLASPQGNSGIGIVLTEWTVREPDVVRFRADVRPALRSAQFPATDVDLVVEVISPESEKRDRNIKPKEYAGAGIPEFWLVEEHADDEADAVVNVHRLDNGRYTLVRSVDLSVLEREPAA
jgi:Uma2 family endonuclease